MTDERYNGWANRETWALNLALSNDHSLYDMTQERVADAMQRFTPYDNDGADDTVPREWAAGEAVKGVWEELTDPAGHYFLALQDDDSKTSLVSMIADVGSVWRVAWDEIGAAWLESVDES